jgi:Proteins of 100 residues with WXG
MAIWGADIAQLKNLGSKLQAGSNEIENQRNTLNKVLEATDWKGPDADKFRNEWRGQHMTALNKVAQALQEAGKRATKNAAEQEQASR